jgi:pimeloyl-ACP methyl ester carboxylesterase
MKLLYAHGFASSPQSRKAKAFQSVMFSRGIEVIIPALDGGDFEHLTISGQLKIMENALDGEPARLIGSSMGGYLAALYAATHPEVDRLVLMAPAFGFAYRWQEKLVPGADFEVFHYGTNEMRRVHYGLIEDALGYPGAPDFNQRALIFHGIHDNVVPVDYSRDFAAAHPNAELIELDSDHELLNVLGAVTDAAAAFLTD